MKAILPALLLIFSLAVPCLAETAEKQWPKADIPFFTKLRMDYAKQKDFDPMWKIDSARDEILKAYQEKEHVKAAALAKTWLEKCPVDADIHYLRAQSLVALGEIKDYAYHLHYFYGLLQSIASGGDGKSPKTAFKVISVAEEYYLLRDFGAELVRQSLEGTCDAMLCRLPGGKEVTYYFDVSIPLNATRRQITPGD